MNWQKFLTIFSLFVVIAAAPTQETTLTTLIKPSDDPFYTPPQGYESYALGEIIDYRKVGNKYGIVTLPEKVSAAYQFLVRSSDSFGNATAIVTTVLVPFNSDPSKVLSYQVAEDAPDPDCAPSYATQLGSDPNTWVTGQIESVLSEAGLYQGWYVVIPDFLGPKSAFAAGIQAGHATLDSLKAVISSGAITGVNSNPKIALWGYSGGSQPSIWAATQAPAYAPSLDIVGVAVGGILIDPYHIAEVSISTAWAGLVVGAINGLANEYPVLKTFIKANLYPQIEAAFFSSTSECLLQNLVSYPFTNWNEVSPLGTGIFDNDLVHNITAENNPIDLSSTPTAPLYFYNSILDEIIPASDADTLYDKWCAAGASIYYRQDLTGGHVTQAVTGSGDALVWLQSRLNGTPQTGCSKVTDITDALNPAALGGLSTILLDLLATFLGAPTKR